MWELQQKGQSCWKKNSALNIYLKYTGIVPFSGGKLCNVLHGGLCAFQDYGMEKSRQV